MKNDSLIKSGIIEEANLLTSDIFTAFSQNALYMAMHTDLFVSQKYDETFTKNIKPETLLSLRLFQADEELLINRYDLMKPFTYRLRCDTNLCEDDFFDETQFLDIDARRSTNGLFYPTTGNKSYSLPLYHNENAIKIRNYIHYSDTGRAEIVDFRIVGFCKKEVE